MSLFGIGRRFYRPFRRSLKRNLNGNSYASRRKLMRIWNKSFRNRYGGF